MKITDKFPGFLDSGNVYQKLSPDVAFTQTETERISIADIIDHAVKVDISAEGAEYYRRYIEENELGMNEIGQLRLGSLNLASLFAQRLMEGASGSSASMGSSGGVDIDVIASGFSSAYAEIYDEIHKGYAEGTREIWVRAEDGSEHDQRLMTMEEEMEALNEAVTFAARFIASNTKMAACAEATMAKIHAEADLVKARHRQSPSLEMEMERLKMINERLRLAEAIDTDEIYERLIGSVSGTNW